LQYGRYSLFAGKLQAILARGYTKGCDLYDLVWYLSDGTRPPSHSDLRHGSAIFGQYDGFSVSNLSQKGCKVYFEFGNT
jgi:hypothetical protein